MLAAVYGQLGELDSGHSEARALLACRPDFAAVARKELEKLWQPELVENLIAGLRKAGLEIANEGKPVDAPPISETAGDADPIAPSIPAL